MIYGTKNISVTGAKLWDLVPIELKSLMTG